MPSQTVGLPDGGVRRRRRLPARKIERTAPQYVKNCHHGNWSLTTWKKDKSALPDGSRYRLTPFRCRSWRHPGYCRNQRATEDVARIRSSIVRDNPTEFLYLVLTFDQQRALRQSRTMRAAMLWRSRALWKAGKYKASKRLKEQASKEDALFFVYRGLLDCWAKLRKRITREWGRFSYVAVVEQHRSGWPHLNVLIRSARLAAACRTETTIKRKGNLVIVQGWRRVRSRWLRRHAVGAGFGPITYIEPVKDTEGISRYLVKLMGQLTGEQAKSSQVPVSAPRHFRRLRSSRGFLPPLPKDDTMTGRLTLAPVEEVATWGAPFVPVEVHTPVDVDTQARPVIVIDYEWDVIPWDAHEMQEAPHTPEERAAVRRDQRAMAGGVWL